MAKGKDGNFVLVSDIRAAIRTLDEIKALLERMLPVEEDMRVDSLKEFAIAAARQRKTRGL